MAGRTVLVLGGSVAGLASAILLARDGNKVVLVDQDELTHDGDIDASTTWSRTGTPHFLQPHALIPRARIELRRHLPDVYELLLDKGARLVDLREKLDSTIESDEELQYVAIRRPVIEWALRRTLDNCRDVTVHSGARADGLLVEHRRVVGARLDGTETRADVVVDAMGRRTPVATWLAEGGIDSEPAELSDCGVIYYSRYYRCRPGFEPPDGRFFLSPRGDLGYLAFASFPGDNGTFAAMFAAPSGVPEWKALHDAEAFERAVASVPALAAWVEPDCTDPITPVMAMAGLKNGLHPTHREALVFAVGDAHGHSDPVLAHGLAFALAHAGELARVLREHEDPRDALEDYLAATARELRERFDYATALDEQRHRMWLGGEVDFGRHTGDYALFTIAAGGVAAMTDADLARVFLRRIGLLDSTRVLDEDLTTRQRIEDAFQAVVARGRPRLGPTREEMLDLIR